MKRMCVGCSAALCVVFLSTLCVLLLSTLACADSLRSTLGRTLFGGAPSLLTVGGQPLLSADPQNFGQPILAIGQVVGEGIGAGLSKSVTRAMSNEILSESVVVPVPSGSGSIAYELDPVLGIFKPLDIGLGPIFNERVNTLGKGHFAFGVTYVRQDFDEFNGQDLSDLQVNNDLFSDAPDLGALIEDGSVEAKLDLDITTNTVAMWGIYGLTERLDVSFLLPITVIDLKARSTVSLAAPDKQSDGTYLGSLRNDLPAFLPDSRCNADRARRNQCRISDFILLGRGTRFTLTDPRSNASGIRAFSDEVDETKAGVGDLLLRAKARFFERHAAAFGGLVELTAPTGDEDNFLGDGAFKARFALLYSQRLWNFRGADRIGFHLNFGGRVTTETSQKNDIEYGSAVDLMVTQWLSLVAEFTAVQRLDAEGLPNDFFHGAFGFKVNPFERLFLNASFRIPANDDGLRSDLVYLVGLEYDF